MSGDAEATSDERRGLLWDERQGPATSQDDLTTGPSQTPRRRTCCASALIVLLLGAVVTPALFYLLREPRPVPDFDSQKLRSNGTHYFKKTALIVSIDGLR